VSNQKARDIIGDLAIRGVCGERVQDRIGHRAWSRPRVAVSDRLYKQYRVPDPWDPDARPDSTPIGLGPVSLRLGEKRREPAPHLKPRPPKEKKKSLAERARSAPRPTVPPKPKPAPVAPKKPAPPAEQLDAKKAAEAARAEAVVERMRAAEAARGKWVRATPSENAHGASSAVAVPLRPDASDAVVAKKKTQQPPHHVYDSRKSRSEAGRFRMKPRAVTSAPVVTQTAALAEVTSPEPPPDRQPPPRSRSMPSAAAGSMDDMFAAAAQMGRLSLRHNEEDETQADD